MKRPKRIELKRVNRRKTTAQLAEIYRSIMPTDNPFYEMFKNRESVESFEQRKKLTLCTL